MVTHLGSSSQQAFETEFHTQRTSATNQKGRSLVTLHHLSQGMEALIILFAVLVAVLGYYGFELGGYLERRKEKARKKKADGLKTYKHKHNGDSSSSSDDEPQCLEPETFYRIISDKQTKLHIYPNCSHLKDVNARDVEELPVCRHCRTNFRKGKKVIKKKAK